MLHDKNNHHNQEKSRDSMIWRSSGLYSYQPKIEMISTIFLEKNYISGEDKIVIFIVIDRSICQRFILLETIF